MAGARRCSRRAPSTYQPACKPGSVGRGMHKTRVNALLLAARDGHSSGTLLAQPLQQPTRTADRRHPIRDFPRAVPIRSCSRWGLPCRFRRRKRGALLPHRFTLAAPSREVAVCFLWHFPWASLRLRATSPAGRYPAPHVHGARTFLPRRLSALVRAAVRPTDALDVGGFRDQLNDVRATSLTDCAAFPRSRDRPIRRPARAGSAAGMRLQPAAWHHRKAAKPPARSRT